MDQSVGAPSAPVARTLKMACGLRHARSVTTPSISATTPKSKRPMKLWCASALPASPSAATASSARNARRTTDRVTHGAP